MVEDDANSKSAESAKLEFEKIREEHPLPADPGEPDPDLLKLLESPPPSNTVKTYTGFDTKALKVLIRSNSEIKKTRTAVDEGLKLLNTELKFLKRILYKNHNRFRNDRGYKSLRILEKSLSKLENFPGSCLTNLITLMPLGLPYSGGGGGTSSVILPPASIPQYTALRMWMVHVLLKRIEFCCENAGSYALQRIALGHFWGVAAYQLCVVSRLWTLCGNLNKNVLKLLFRLRILANNLPGKSFYSEDIMKKIFHSCETVTEKSKTKEQPSPEEVLNTSHMNMMMTETNHSSDLGVKVKREDFSNLQSVTCTTKGEDERKLPKPEKQNSPPDLKFLSDLHSYADLKTFLDRETLQRKSDRKSAITRKLKQDEWKQLRKELLSEFSQKLPNKSIKKSRKRLREALV